MGWVTSKASLFSRGVWGEPPQKNLKFELFLGTLRPIMGGKLNNMGGLTLSICI